MKPVITVLKLGHAVEDRSGNLYMTDPGIMMEVSFNAAAVEVGGQKILIDTGLPDTQMLPRGTVCRQDSQERLDAGLAMIGWSPAEVDIVINTHLHFDHCGQNKLFRQARFLVQKKEWQVAHHPIATQVGIYMRELFDPPAVDSAAWNFIDGEYEVAPGLTIIPTPGHTAGHQSVIVDTSEGRAVYSGDVVNLLENLVRNIPPSIMIDVSQCLESMETIRRLGQFIIPGHNPIVRPGQNSSFPPIPKDYSTG
jgi:N-acyl homoserine lactone hydrolase